ncbi:MAG: hypothetical protein A3J14_01955 [Candidatus Levybacteria bacterium RIFCSPLOWO2_02_FULL_37_18]|nr:MAG: hypothetical protein A3J14_01955 [Candidatus Levybacteria bacterium RIFCSPLOWO2_02_FULL_37_18]
MNKFFLSLIIFTAMLLRFLNLGSNPPSLTWDEAAWGYNAYSLGIDGRDEFGRFLPYDYLESFGDFKPPVYAYLDILPVKLFGLTEFATRFPSALMGVLTVFLTYFLVKEIFKNSQKKEIYALVSSFLLAISPWHIMLSRAAFEANVATFFTTCGIWLFLKGRENKWGFSLSAISFVLSIYTFNSARIVAPLLVLFLVGMFHKDITKKKKQATTAFFIGFILILPIVKFLFSPQATLRFKEVNIFSDFNIIKRVNQQIENDHNARWSSVLHNRRFVFTVEYLKHYFDNLSSSFLFIKGDGNPKFSTQQVGQLYMWEIPFLIAGVLFLIRKKEGLWLLVPIWLLIGIIPAGSARETPHALRIEASLPTFQILVAYGLINSMEKLKRWKLVTAGLSLVIFFNLIYFLHDYYVHYPVHYSREWQYGYKESVRYVVGVQNNFKKVWVTQNLGRPYMYYLFYLHYNPSTFRTNSDIKRDVFGFVHVKRFDKYFFGDNNRISRAEGKGSLFVNTYDQVPNNAKILKDFKLLNRDSYLVVYTK